MQDQLAEKGPKLSRLIAGVMTWGVWGTNFSAANARKYIEQCLDLGITTFDHADIYGHYTTEELFGEATNGAHSLRQKMQLITKCGIKLTTPNRPSFKIKSYDTSKEHILHSVDTSLKNLKTDYIDLLLIHRPSPLMQPTEIAEAFLQLKQDGKVLHFGVSNFTPSQFEMLNSYHPLMTNQVKASLLHRDPFLDGTFDQCLQHKIAPMAYSTMASGKFFSAEPDTTIKRIQKIGTDLAEQYNATYEEILTAWLLKHPAKIFPIMGSTKIQRMQAAVNALAVDMTREEWFMLWQAAVGEEVP